MSPQMPTRRRRLARQDGLGALTAVAGAAAAVVLVAGAGWAIAQAGGDGSSTGPGAAGQQSTATTSPTTRPSHSKHQAWSKQCGKAATAASHHGYAVLAPAELPAGWTVRSCSFATATGWHLVVRADHGTLSVTQRKGDPASVVAAVLGPGAHQGGDVHAQGTGTWQSWAGSGGRNALSRALSSSGVVLSGRAGVATLNRLASVLLTYESAPNGNNGG